MEDAGLCKGKEVIAQNSGAKVFRVNLSTQFLEVSGCSNRVLNMEQQGIILKVEEYVSDDSGEEKSDTFFGNVEHEKQKVTAIINFLEDIVNIYVHGNFETLSINDLDSPKE